MRAFQTLMLAALATVFGCKGSTGAGDPAASGADAPVLRVAAAADLSFAFEKVGAAFEAKTGQRVTFSFGSSGLLAKQIAEGAPFDVFASANEVFVDDVLKDHACLADSKALYARGHIVLFSAKGAAPANLASLVDPRFVRIAIANPEHAPYGRAARQALMNAGVWEAVKSKIVFGENVRQTMTFIQSGNADVGLVALSLATQSPGEYTRIDEDQHDPINQAIVVCKGEAKVADGAPNAKSDSAARSFVGYVNSAEGRTIMRRFGLLLSGEKLAEKR